MKFIMTADIHMKMWPDNAVDDSGFPMKVSEIFKALDQMCEHARKNDINTIVFAGDTNDLKNKIDTDPFVRLKEYFSENTDINFILLHGNHDASNKNEIRSAIQLLEGSSNVRTIVDPLVEDNITFLPYSKTIVDDINNQEANDILISHFGLSEAQLSSGISVKTRLKIGDLSKFKLVLLGHYHKPQKLGNVYYAGSPIQFRKDEYDEEKRFLVVDTETLNVESIPTTDYRRFYTLVIHKPEDAKKIIKEAQELQSKGNWVRIRKEFKESIDVGIDEIELVDDYEEDYISRGIVSSMNREQIFNKYLEIEGVTEKEEYISVITDVLNEPEEGT